MGNHTLTKKQTRARFLMSLGAFSLAALAGCAGGAPPDSTFVGTYLSTYTLPAIGENGTFSFSIEQKGKMVGSFTDASTNLVYAFDGVVENNGKFTGTLKNGATTSTISGLLVVNGSGSSGNTGAGGDFNLVRSGAEHRGYFTIGGSLTNVTSDYKGNYTGAYNLFNFSQTGLASFTVDSKGNIIGSVTKGTETALFSGTIANSGAFTATAAFAGASTVFTGTLSKTTDNSTQGNFTATRGGSVSPGAFSKIEGASSTGSSPYQGTFDGNYGIPEQGESGSLSLTIGTSGDIIGFFTQSLNKPVGTLGDPANPTKTTTVNADGTFQGTITYNAADVAALPVAEQAAYQSRPIIGKLDKSGTGLAGDFVITINAANRAGNFNLTVKNIASAYRGTFSNSNIISGIAWSGTAPAGGPVFPTFIGADGSPISLMSISVDKEGTIIGTLGGQVLDAHITNDSRIIGKLGTFTLRGTVTHQQVGFLDTSTAPPKVIFKDGIAGNLLISVGGTEYPATIAGIGGSVGG